MTRRQGNRLARETSPYLLLHAENPVDWYAWGEEAFAAARREDKPIFLSVGYSTCYWCHVMERECFSDPEIAAQMNAGFVSIKLDREERPDVDEIYMAATQLLTRSGGWPNSVFLTHDLKPFFAGTYFPPTDRMGRPGFPRVLASLREAWALRRGDVLGQAETVAEAVRQQMGADGAPGVLPGPSLTAEAEALLSRRFDPEYGGFGSAPKFPSPSNLFFLLDRARTGSAEAREMVVVTLDRMARGGIHDQLAGGFHRYSTDPAWLVPHFEKMLYDNAALATLYADAAPLAPEAGFDRVARLTLEFVLSAMTGPGGGFLSAIDAETDGHEGAYYTWTLEELDTVLDPPDRALLGVVLGFDGPPSFEGDRYVLHLPAPLSEAARTSGLETTELLARMEPGRRALLEAREKRKQPLTDDKVLTDWNGLMIGAMARVGRALREPRYVDAARAAARFVLERLRSESGELLHVYRDGTAKVPALLDDYAFLVDGLLALHVATDEPSWVDEAARLTREQTARLWDAAGGGFFAAAESADLLVRGRPAHDGAVASGNGVAASNLMQLARLLGDNGLLDRADELLRRFGGPMAEWPLGHLTLVRAWDRRGVRDGGSVATRERPRAPLAAAAASVVQVRASLGSADGSWRRFRIELGIEPGWHLNANPPLLRFLVATEVKALSAPIRGVRYPVAERYEGTVAIEGEVESAGGGPVTVSLVYQPCDEERCLTPVTREVEIG
jgi:uncharacterized protein YyaL (SSP411 family)